METFAIPFLLFVGTMLAVQAAANVQLSTATGSPFGASTLQLGIAAVLLLAAAAVAGTLGAIEGAVSERAGWIALALVAGEVLPLQGAVNGQLRADLDAPATVGALSFLVATAAMALALGSRLL